MNGTIASMNAALRWDLGDFDRGTAHIEGVFGKLRGLASDMSDAFVQFGRRMTLGISVPTAAIALYTVNAASDVKEMQSAFDYTFGAMSARMNKWAEDTGDAMGRSTDEMQKGALAMGQLFTKAAPTEEAAARLSQRFATLAQDASSFFNTDYDTALDKIRSGLSGESEPLRAFGVFLNEAAVEAKGLELGLIKTGQSLNEMGKIMARAALIQEGLSVATGDVVRTSDSFANRVRALIGDIHELVVELGERFLPVAEKIVGWLQAAARWVQALPEPVKDMAVSFAAVLAVIGPLSLALSALVVTVLPLFLARMSPIFFIVSAIINPLGTAVITLLRFAASWTVLSTALSFAGGLLLRASGLLLATPWGRALALMLLFKDRVVAAFGAIWREAQEKLGPAFEQMLARLGQAIEDLTAMFDDLARSPVGQMLAKLVSMVGDVVQAFIELAGSAVIGAIEQLMATIGTLAQMMSSSVALIRALISGDWSRAWDLAASIVGTAMMRIAEWIKWIMPGLASVLTMLGRLMGGSLDAKPVQMGAAPTSGAKKGDGDNLFSGSGNYAEAGKAKTKTATGPSAEDLAWRREDIRLQQAFDVARESGNQDEERALRRQMEKRDRIQDYRRAGLALALATTAAEKDMLELDAAKAIARAKAIESEERAIDIQLAQIRGDYEILHALEDQEFLERQKLLWQQKGIDLLEAEKLAQLDLKNLERARADQVARRLADQARESELELARLRGDSDAAIRAMEENIRRRERAEELRRDFDYSPDAARGQAEWESAQREQAVLQGSVRDAFRNGIRAGLDGNLGDFFETWMKDRAFNALTDVLDRLADQIANLLARQGSGGGGGGIFGAIVSGLGAVLGGGDPLAGSISTANANVAGMAATLNTPRPLAGFATGGSFRIKAFPGVDSNVLSINSTPVARVTDGEIVDIQRAGARNDNGGGGRGSFMFDLRGAVMTEDLLRQMQDMANDAEEKGAAKGAASVFDTNKRTYGRAMQAER
ncbi:MAG: hypothetical protein COA80_16230 [Leeuwenhoekiella sp.]|nr:MAG: hypothetical protein COA80_16230 [Leeuwenhoekiella sp.]